MFTEICTEKFVEKYLAFFGTRLNSATYAYLAKLQHFQNKFFRVEGGGGTYGQHFSVFKIVQS
jgi:hypothetical protein